MQGVIEILKRKLTKDTDELCMHCFYIMRISMSFALNFLQTPNVFDQTPQKVSDLINI